MEIRKAFSTFLIAIASTTFATDYYVGPNGNDANSGTDPAAPWRTIDKVNQMVGSYAPGDNILFERGGVYRGTIVLGFSGDPGNPITFGAYGAGPDPVISGSRVVSNWVQHSGSIWKASISGPIKYVFSNGALQTLARYPNNGDWLRNNDGSATSIFDNDLSQPYEYWTGSEAVIRSTNWSYDVTDVTSFENGLLTFTNIGNDLQHYDWGYFLQNKFEELDEAGEWYFDASNQELYFWAPGGVDPNTISVEVASELYGVQIYTAKHDLRIQDIHFKHQTDAGVKNSGISIEVLNCTFTDLFKGVVSYGSTNTYSENHFEQAYGMAIQVIDDGTVIDNNDFLDIAQVPGLGESNWGYFGIRSIGMNTSIINNRFTNIGYIAIDAKNNTLIENNVIKNALSTLNDGGGIAFDDADGMIIRNNIVMDIHGNLESVSTNYYNGVSICMGIYFGNTSIKNTTVEGNTVANISGTGIHVDHTMVSEGNRILNNVIYNNENQIGFSDFSNYNGPGATPPYYVPQFDTEIAGNVFCSLQRDQDCMVQLQVHSAAYTDFGNFHDNIYYNPFNEQSIVIRDNYAGNTLHYFTLAKWQDEYQEDANSLASPFWMDEYIVTDTLSGNLIMNGDMENSLDNWYWWPSDATVSLDLTSMDGAAMSVSLTTNNTSSSVTVNHQNNASVEDGEKYLLSYSTKSLGHGEITPIFHPNSYSWGQAQLMERDMPLDTNRRDQAFVFESDVTDQGQIHFKTHYTSADHLLDNIALYKVDADPVVPEQILVLFYNETAQPTSVPLIGCWQQMNGVDVSGSIALNPFSSVVLRKMADDDCVINGGQFFNIKVLLSGPYDESTGLMDDDLRDLEFVPSTEPYTALGFDHHASGGGETTTNAVLASNGEDAIIDWVLVELRDINDPSIVLYTRSALLQRDGDIVDIDGISSLSFNTTETELYLSVRHRTHLGIMTFDPVELGQGAVMVDLTDPATPLYGSNATRLSNNDKRLLWTGNSVPDAIVKYSGGSNDRDPILNAIGGQTPTDVAVGYHSEDVNMDGLVKYTGPNNDRDEILFSIGGMVPTQVLVEQLP